MGTPAIVKNVTGSQRESTNLFLYLGFPPVFISAEGRAAPLPLHHLFCVLSSGGTCQQTSSVFLAKDVAHRERPQGGNGGSVPVIKGSSILTLQFPVTPLSLRTVPASKDSICQQNGTELQPDWVL